MKMRILLDIEKQIYVIEIVKKRHPPFLYHTNLTCRKVEETGRRAGFSLKMIKAEFQKAKKAYNKKESRARAESRIIKEIPF